MIFYGYTYFSRVISNPHAAYKKWQKDRKDNPLNNLGRTSIDRENLSLRDKRTKDQVDYVCLNVLIFYSILLNYLYTTFFHDLTIVGIV